MSTTIHPVNESKWQNQLAALIAHMKATDGHVPYPRRGQPSEIERIGQWVQKQRKAYRNGTISPERRDRLNEIDPRILIPAQTHRSLDEVAFLRGVESARLAVKNKVKTADKVGEPLTPEGVEAIIDAALNELALDPSQRD